MKRTILTLFVLLLTSCRFFVKKDESFHLVQITPRNLVRYVEANGSVEALSVIDIYSPVAGRLEKIFIKEGDMVAAKQKVALVSSDARTFFLDTAATKGKKELEYWQQQIQLTPIIAPTSGKVIAIKADLDDKIAGPIAQLSKGEVVRANVDEADLPGLHVGQPVLIRFDIASGVTLHGQLDKIAQTSKLVNNVNVYQAEVSLPVEEARKDVPFEVKIGMSVTLNFPVEEKKDALALPIDAVDGKAMTVIVMRREDDQKTKVRLGGVFGEWVEVISGAKLGDKFRISKFKMDQQRARKSPLMIRKD